MDTFIPRYRYKFKDELPHGDKRYILTKETFKKIHLLLSCNLIIILFHKNLFNYLLSLKV